MYYRENKNRDDMRTEVCNSLCGLHESRELLILDGRVASYKKVGY